MIILQEEHDIACPYCGETMTILIDPDYDRQQYVEDCQICCQPMLIDIKIDDGQTAVIVRQENG